MIARQKCTTAFAVGCSCNATGKRPGSGSSPTQSRLFCWREAVTNFSRKFMTMSARIPLCLLPEEEAPLLSTAFPVPDCSERRGRACCQCALMHRTVKPKLLIRKDLQHCGGVQMQASGVSPGVLTGNHLIHTLITRCPVYQV